jgi:hypothetical protein
LYIYLMKTTALSKGTMKVVVRISGREATWTAVEGAWMTSTSVDVGVAEARMAALRADGWRPA